MDHNEQHVESNWEGEGGALGREIPWGWHPGNPSPDQESYQEGVYE